MTHPSVHSKKVPDRPVTTGSTHGLDSSSSLGLGHVRSWPLQDDGDEKVNSNAGGDEDVGEVEGSGPLCLFRT